MAPLAKYAHRPELVFAPWTGKAMEEQALENGSTRDSPEAETGAESSKSGGTARVNVKLMLAAVVAGGVLAVAATFWILGQSRPQEVQPTLTEAAKPLIASSRAMDIRARRNQMRSENRSSHNQYLVQEKGPQDMVWLASQAELTLLSGLFNHYMEITARFYEMFRILSNDYLNERWQVLSLFENKILPKFDNAERRRKLLRRRIEHDPALELFDNLDYIAYYDSIAVQSFHTYLKSGGEDEFNTAIENVNTAKFMIKDFWNYFQRELNEYGVSYKPSPDVWRRYYAPWELKKP